MCRDEFRLSQIKLQNADAKDFIRSPWMPNLLVTIYRGIFAGYCLGWIIASGFHPANGNEKWFIYLTNWGFFLLTLYFICATVVCILHHCACSKIDSSTVIQMKSAQVNSANVESAVADDHNASQDTMDMCWYHKGLWLVFNIAANAAVLITLLYWSLVFNGVTSGLDVSTHAMNSVFILADLMLSAIPVRILHTVYVWVFGLCYLLLTVIFWAVGGTNARDEPYIYSYIDYNRIPGLSSGIIVSFIVVGQPLVQALLFGLYKLRNFLSLKCGKKLTDSGSF